MSEGEPKQIFLKPVETFHCAPDDTEEKAGRMNRYFEEVVDLLNYNDSARAAFLRIEYKTPYFEGTDATLYPTNDNIAYLTAQDRLIAFTLEARTEFNFIDVTMVCILTPELLSQLQNDERLLREEGM